VNFKPSRHLVLVILILLGLAFLSSFLSETLTGASVYYPPEERIIFRNPEAARPRQLDTQVLSVNKIITPGVYAPSGTPLSLAATAGVRLEGGATFTVPTLSGIGSAYACVNAKGQLYRSARPCT